MTSAKATEFLTKQLSIENETVTFRWLSRKLSVHVNAAKNELASYYALCRSTDTPVHATYLLTGDVAPIKATGCYHNNNQDEMNMGMEHDNQESVATSKIILVGEDDLESEFDRGTSWFSSPDVTEEAAKAQFRRVPSVHIYSLSPSAIRDAALLVPMADRVRPDDVSKGEAYNQIIGIVAGPDVKISQATKPSTSKLAKTNAFVGSSSKLNTPAAAKNVAEKPKSTEKGRAPEKPKQDQKQKSTLDWSKAKVIGEKEQENETTAIKAPKEIMKKQSKLGFKENGEKTKPEVKKVEDSKVKLKKELTEASVATKVVESDKLKRGTKRPSAVMSPSDSEGGNPSPKTRARTSDTLPLSRASEVKVRKGVLLSDDDEERANEMKPTTTKQKGKGRAPVAEEEGEGEGEIDPSVRFMMEVDDFTRHNNLTSASNHQSDGDIGNVSHDDTTPARPKVKRKPKKVIPVGKNGLPKRRVMKSRKSKNAKGYTVTEDYSSYESVSESERVQAAPDTETIPKASRKRSKMDDTDNSHANSHVSKSKGNPKSKDKVDNHPAEIEGGSQTIEGKRKPGSGSSGGGSTPRSGANASNVGKNNLMSYFNKK